MQIMAEALGLALPGSALLPATSLDLVEYARRAGYQAVVLAKQGLRPSDVVTMDSFENAIMVHAAISAPLTPCSICLLSPMNLASPSTATPLTVSTAAQSTCWTSARPAAGPQSSSTMPAACLPSWRRSGMCSISTP